VVSAHLGILRAKIHIYSLCLVVCVLVWSFVWFVPPFHLRAASFAGSTGVMCVMMMRLLPSFQSPLLGLQSRLAPSSKLSLIPYDTQGHFAHTHTGTSWLSVEVGSARQF